MRLLEDPSGIGAAPLAVVCRDVEKKEQFQERLKSVYKYQVQGQKLNLQYSSVHNSTQHIFDVERYVGWCCILNCFMLSPLPCFYAFCCSAIPTSCYIFNVFYSNYMCILWIHSDWKLILCTGSYVIIELTSTPLLITGSSGVAHIPSKILIVNFQCSILVMHPGMLVNEHL